MGISLTERNADTTQKLSCGVITTIGIKNIRTTSNSTGTLLSQNIPCYMPLLSGVVCYIVELNRSINDKRAFLDCAIFSFGERYAHTFTYVHNALVYIPYIP